MLAVTPTFEIDPWQIRDAAVDPGGLGVSETVFSQYNGHLGIRGTLDEQRPRAASRSRLPLSA